MVDVSAILIHFGSVDYTRHVVACLRAQRTSLSMEIIVVDNASASQPEFDMHEAVPLRVVRMDEARGYGAACNTGAAAASGRYLLILNNDLDISETAIEPLVAALEADSSVGAAGPKLQFPDGRFQLSWGEDATLLNEFRERGRQKAMRGGEATDREPASGTARRVDWITGAAMLIRRSAWDDVGGFDEAYFFYFEDADICRRLRLAGHGILFQPSSCIVHFGGGSDPLSNPRIVRAYRREQLRYYARYNSVAQFYLLKMYLLTKFLLLAARGGLDRSTSHALISDILSFRRSEGAIHHTRKRT